VTSVSGTGTIKINLDKNLSNITDSLGTPERCVHGCQMYNIDQTAPTVSSIVRADVNPTSATTVNFTVTISKPVTGVAAGNFTAVGVGVTGTVGTVTGSETRGTSR